MAETPDKQTPDLVELWRDWLTQSERQLNSFFGETLNQEASARAVAGYMELYAALQRLLAEAMQRYLSFINMPSRNDVVGLGETLRSIEDRLARIEETLQIAAEAVDARERSAPAFEPARTRRPIFPGAEDSRGEQPAFPGAPRPEVSPIPEELRR